LDLEHRTTTLSRLRLAATAAALAATCAASGSAAGARAGQPRAVFSGASARIDNPWFPVRPGTTYVYGGFKDGESGRDVLTMTRRTEVVDGVRCAVIDDRLYLAGRLAERTTDWYAQDSAGTVWYLGEATAELDRSGRVKTTDGSFRDGRGGARRGIMMPADPRVGQSFAQESDRGHAEDHFKIVNLSGRVTTPAASSRDAMVTTETTPLEPGTVDRKVYVRGIGTVREETVKGGSERFVLIAIRRG
jgi:hypothetical protein